MQPIFDPAKIFADALPHVADDLQKVEMVSRATLNKYASPNECSNRPNPITRIARYLRVFWHGYKPAFYATLAYLRETEIQLMNTSLPPERFSARELLRNLRTITSTVEAMEEGGASEAAFAQYLPQVQAEIREHLDRAIAAHHQPATEPLPEIYTLPAGAEPQGRRFNARVLKHVNPW